MEPNLLHYAEMRMKEPKNFWSKERAATDTKQIEYILQIAQENNITRAAEKLFITQSALNQQLLRLEKELGTPLFFRSRTDWHPTQAGEVYIQNAKEIMQIKKNTYRVIRDIVDSRKGHLSIGFTPERGISMFSAVYPKFYEEFPDITVEPLELSVKKQQAAISSGELDIGFLTLCEEQYTNDEYIPICSEEIYLAVPANRSLKKSGFKSSHQMPLALNAVKDTPFTLIYKESTIRFLIDRLFQETGVHPQILFETASNRTVMQMIQSNMCCGLLPSYYIKEKCSNIAYFSLPEKPSWQIVASYKKGNYLSYAAKRFIELAADYWKEHILPVTA